MAWWEFEGALEEAFIVPQVRPQVSGGTGTASGRWLGACRPERILGLRPVLGCNVSVTCHSETSGALHYCMSMKAFAKAGNNSIIITSSRWAPRSPGYARIQGFLVVDLLCLGRAVHE